MGVTIYVPAYEEIAESSAVTTTLKPPRYGRGGMSNDIPPPRRSGSYPVVITRADTGRTP